MTEEDVTALELASRLDEEGWYQLAKMAEMGLSAAAIVHEVRQPLSALKMALQLMREGGGKNGYNGAEARQCLDDALQQTERLERLLAQMRSFLRPSARDRTEVDLGRLTDGVLVLLTGDLKSKNVEVEVGFEDDLPPAFVEKHKIEQILFNLIVNARDAVIDIGGGRIVVLVKKGPKGGVEVVVADDGTGISPEHAEKIFEPFFSTKGESKGTGLGLYIARRIAEQHGAVLELLDDDRRAELGRGKLATAFRMAFTDPRQRLTIPPPVPTTKRVNHALIVVGEETTQDRIRELVEQEGFRSTIVANGEEAIPHLGDDSFDMLVVDWELPVITGLEVTRLARNFNPLLPTLFLVTQPTNELDEEIAALGMASCALRTAAPDRLRLKLQEILKSDRRSKGTRSNKRRSSDRAQSVDKAAEQYSTNSTVSVILVEIEAEICEILSPILTRLGGDVLLFDSASAAGERIGRGGGDILVARPEVLKANRSWFTQGSAGGHVHAAMALMDSGGVDRAIEAIHLGAHGVFSPPFDEDKISFEFRRALNWVMEDKKSTGRADSDDESPA